MKKSIIISLLLAGLFISAYCQAPYNFNYQAVARDLSGNVLTNTAVKLKISILKTSITGEPGYSETHLLTTNNFGLLNLEIGKGNEKSGSIEAIKWGLDKYFIKIEMDKNGGNNFKVLGTSQLLSVPYSLFSCNGVQYNMSLTCNEITEGMIRYNYEKKTMEFCDGVDWNSFGSGGSQTCGEDFIDPRDGQVYPTIKIGSQCWMAKNLNYGIFKESVFTNDGHVDVSNNGIVEKYAYDNDVSQLEIYGGLYDWNELMNYQPMESGQGICPDGWHIPSYDEFVELVEASGDWLHAGKALKVGGSTGFQFPMGGNRREKGNFTGGLGSTGSIWSSTISGSNPDTRAWNIYFIENGDNAAKATDLMSVGKSVRCVK